MHNMKNKRFSLFLTIAFVYFSATANIAFGDTGADRIDLRYPAVVENPGNVAVGFKSSAGIVSMSLTPYSVSRRYLNFILDRHPGSFEVSTRLE